MAALSRRPLTLAARGAVLLAMAGGSIGYSLAGSGASPGNLVTISADGQTRSLHTHGADVAAALAAAGLSVGSHDVVAPSLSEPLHDGSQIVIDRARPLDLTVDGTERTVWVTQANLSDAAGALGLRLDGAYVSADRSRAIPVSGLALTVRLPQQVSLVVGGVASTVTTTEPTVAQLLTDQQVVLGPYDTVSAALDAYPTAGSTIEVTRVSHTQWLQRNRLGIPTRRVADHHLTVGTIELAHGGVAGTHYRLWGIVKSDGRVVAQKLLQQRTVAAKPRVLLIGTKPKAVVIEAVAAEPASRPGESTERSASVPRTSSGSGLDWAALAQCESGGDPRSVDGPYYGLYQFTLGTWQSVGGSGRPSDASAAEQTYRAKLLYAQQGRSPWPSCGHNL